MTKQETEPSVLGLTPNQYASLTDTAIVAVTQLSDHVHQRQTNYARLGMVCGTLGFLACIGAFAYLVIQGHSTEAYVVLGAAVLALIRSILNARL